MHGGAAAAERTVGHWSTVLTLDVYAVLFPEGLRAVAGKLDDSPDSGPGVVARRKKPPQVFACGGFLRGGGGS